MPGVPHSSKRCDECKRTKKKCDLQEPSCTGCLRKGIKCSGIRKGFVHFSYNRRLERQIHFERLETKPEAKDDTTTTLFWPSNLSKANSIPQCISAGPLMHYQLFSFHLTTFFPREANMTREPNMRSSIHTWDVIISNIMTLPRKSQMLETACSALPCVYLGKIHHDARLFRYGLRLFNHAIRLLSNMMSRGSYTEEVIHTCVIFREIQVYYCPDTITQALTHIEGLTAIVRIHGPRVLKNPTIAAMYKKNQKWSIVFSMFMEMTREEIEFLQEPAGDKPMDGLLRCFTETTRITCAIEEVDSSDHGACQSLLDSCIALEKFHGELYPKIRQDVQGDPPTYHHTGELDTDIPATDNVFGPAYQFSSLDDARLHMFFWLSLSFFYPVLYKCHTLVMANKPGYVSADSPQKWCQSDEHRLSELYAYKLARAFPYCGQKSMGICGLYYGLQCTIQISRTCSHARNWEGFLWADSVLKYIEKLGFDTATRVRQYWWQYWFNTDQHNFHKCATGRGLARAGR